MLASKIKYLRRRGLTGLTGLVKKLADIPGTVDCNYSYENRV